MIDQLRTTMGLCAALFVTATSAHALMCQDESVHPHQPGIDVLHYDFTIEVPDTGRAIEGRAVLTVRRYQPVASLRLDLVALRVDSVLVDGAPSAFSRDSATITLSLPRLTALADTFAVVVRYGGIVRDGLIISSDASGRWTAFGDNWPDRGRHWLPGVDHPSDKATVSWNIAATADRRVVANGNLVGETPLAPSAGDGPMRRTLTRWRTDRPIPVYVMVIGVAPLIVHDLGVAAKGLSEFRPGVRQSVYVYPELRDYLPGPFAEAGSIVEFFARTIGPFPYEKLAHVQSSTIFGGMENASAIFYSDRAFRTRTVGRGVIAHETAHQWFGNAVTPREWPHLWLSEGFATYFEMLFVEHSDGKQGFRRRLERSRRLLLASEVAASRPVIDTAETNLLSLLNDNSYQKGAWILHMLRSLVGDSLFFEGIRTYYARHRHGTVLTSDLQAAMEEITGRSLGWFFDQWLHRPGFPELRIYWRYHVQTGELSFTVTQDGERPPFRFPLTVEAGSTGGASQRLSVEIPAEPNAGVTFCVPLAGRPASVVVDPDVQLLARITVLEEK